MTKEPVFVPGLVVGQWRQELWPRLTKRANADSIPPSARRTTKEELDRDKGKVD
jgi:hypothetical protein